MFSIKPRGVTFSVSLWWNLEIYKPKYERVMWCDVWSRPLQTHKHTHMGFLLYILDDNSGEGWFCWHCTVVSDGCVGCDISITVLNLTGSGAFVKDDVLYRLPFWLHFSMLSQYCNVTHQLLQAKEVNVQDARTVPQTGTVPAKPGRLVTMTLVIAMHYRLHDMCLKAKIKQTINLYTTY